MGWTWRVITTEALKCIAEGEWPHVAQNCDAMIGEKLVNGFEQLQCERKREQPSSGDEVVSESKVVCSARVPWKAASFVAGGGDVVARTNGGRSCL